MNEIKKLGGGKVKTRWGVYGELAVSLAAAADVSPRTLVKDYARAMIQDLGLSDEVLKAIESRIQA